MKIDDSIKLFVKEEIGKSEEKMRERAHSLKKDLTDYKFEMNRKFEEERDKSNSLYAPIIVKVAIFSLIWFIVFWVVWAILRLVILAE